ncbi:MAG: hypothetical protein ABFD97_12780 [Syntrophobacter sp.]
MLFPWSANKRFFLTSLLCALVMIALSACAGVPVSKTSTQSTTKLQPSAGDVAHYADSWLTNLVGALQTGGAQAVNTLCQAGVMNSEECGYAAIGQALLPAFVTVAQAALGAFKSSPTPANQLALQTAMESVYEGAKAVNSQ